MANTPPTLPPSVLPPSLREQIEFQINGTLSRIYSCRKDETTQQMLERPRLEAAQARYQQGGLSGKESAELRAEIARLSQIVYPGLQVGPVPNAAEQGYFAAQRAEMNNLGIIAAGPVLGGPAAAARVLGAPEQVVEAAGEAGMNIGMAGFGGEGAIEPIARPEIPRVEAPIAEPPPNVKPPAPPPPKPTAPPPPPGAETAPPRKAEEPPPAPSTFVARRKPSKAELREEANNRRIDDYLRAKGKNVQDNPDEGQPGMGRQGDRIVDGKPTEYKTLDPGADDGTIRNTVNNSIRNEGQARDIIIDARGTGMTIEQAAQGVIRAEGISRGMLDSIMVIGDNFEVNDQL